MNAFRTIMMAALLLAPLPTFAQAWQFKTYTTDGGARSGTIAQAEAVGEKGERAIIGCNYNGVPFLTFIPGSDYRLEPVAIRLDTEIQVGGKSQKFSLGSFKYSLGGHSAPVSRDFIAALGAGSVLYIGIPGDNHFAGGWSLQGSSRALAQLDCI